MMKSTLSKIAVLFCLPLIAGPGLAQDRQQKLTGGSLLVEDVIRVDCKVEATEPPTLVVSAIAVNPEGLSTNPRFIRAVYETPPDDGIQDYLLLVVPPIYVSNGSGSPPTRITVKNTWKG